MGLLKRVGRHARSAWDAWWRGGAEAFATHVVLRLRARLGVDDLETRVRMAAAAASTWSVTSWIEQAVLDQTPLVSVILPTHNRSHLLLRAVGSVRSQAYPNWELVVVDDGSNDETPRVLERLGDEIGPDRLKVLRTPSGGVCAARNHGLAVAKGSLIAYLDDDNVMHPLWLKSVVWAFGQRPDVEVLYGGVVVDDILRLNRRAAGALPTYHLVPFERARLVRENLADIGAIAHRSGLPEARFDETLREMGDWDLLLRLTREKAPLVLPAVACFYSTAGADRLSGGPTFEADAARVQAKARKW